MDTGLRAVTIQIKEFIGTGNIEAALDHVQTYEGQYGDEPEFLKVKAVLCMSAGEYDTAIRILKKVEDRKPDDAEIYYLLTKCYESRTNQSDCNDDYPQVTIVDTDGNTPPAYTDDLNAYKNRDTAEELTRSNTDPLVSIYFLAYNNLEKYTKPAIEALLKYTQGIDYELILVDNGSSDDTFEYFQSIPVDNKRIYRITKNLGAGYGYVAASNACRGRFYRGKFVAVVPNDILVTRNWLDNMLACIRSDEKIGMVVPMSNYVSNYEAVDLGYRDLQEMQVKAAVFNQADPKKWEERLRLIPSVLVVRTLLWNMYENDSAFIYNFMDDDVSIMYRRLGYKLMLCGDAFVHHAGSTVTGSDPDKYRMDLEKGRKIFRTKYYGIDAWDDIAAFEYEMRFAVLKDCLKKRENNILGIDVCCGSALLNLKNGLRIEGMEGAVLSAYTEDPKYWLDLKTICEGDVYVYPITQIGIKVTKKYDYIIVGKYINEYAEWKRIADVLMERLGAGGRLVFKLKRHSGLERAQQIFECLHGQALYQRAVKDKQTLETMSRKKKGYRFYIYPLQSRQYAEMKSSFFTELRRIQNHTGFDKIKDRFTEDRYDDMMQEWIVVIEKTKGKTDRDSKAEL